MSYLTDKLREALDVNQESATWSPNNYRAIFLGRNFFCVVEYIGGIKVVNLDLQKVYEEFQRCSSGLRTASLDPLFNERKFSCLEELYIDTSYSQPALLKLFNAPEYIKSLEDARLRVAGYLQLVDGRNVETGVESNIVKSIKRCFSSKEATELGYLYIKDPNKYGNEAPFWAASANGQISGVHFLNKPNWYKMHSLRPTDYAMDIDGGELWKYFDKYDRLGSSLQSSANKDSQIKEISQRVHNDCNNQYLVTLYRLFASYKSWASSKDLSENSYQKVLLEKLEAIFEKSKKESKGLGYLSGSVFKESLSEKVVTNTFLNNSKQQTKPMQYFSAYLTTPTSEDEAKDKVAEYLQDIDAKLQGNKGLIPLYTVFCEMLGLYNFCVSKYPDKVQQALAKVGVQRINASLSDMIPCLKVIKALLEDAANSYKSKSQESSEAITTLLANQILEDIKDDNINWYLEYTYYYSQFVKVKIQNEESYEGYALKVLSKANMPANRVFLKETEFNKALKEAYMKDENLMTNPVLSDPHVLKSLYKRSGVIADAGGSYTEKDLTEKFKSKSGLLDPSKIFASLAVQLYNKITEITKDDTFCRTFLDSSGLKVVDVDGETKLYSVTEEEYEERRMRTLSQDDFSSLGSLTDKHKKFIQEACSYKLEKLKELLK